MKQSSHGTKQIKGATVLGLPAQLFLEHFQKSLGVGRCRLAIGRVVRVGCQLIPTQKGTIWKKSIHMSHMSPDQVTLHSLPWARGAVRQLSLAEFQVLLPIFAVGFHPWQLGFIPQKPVMLACDRRLEEVKSLIQEESPAVKTLATPGNASWDNETSLRPSDVWGRGFALMGKTSHVAATAKYENLSMDSAFTREGRASWTIENGTIYSIRVIDFLDRLIKDAQRTLCTVWTNLRVHYSVKVK